MGENSLNDAEVIPTTPISPKKRKKTVRHYGLAPRDILFCVKTFEYKDATKAYLEVISRKRDVLIKTAHEGASKMMARENVRLFMRDLFENAAKAAAATPNRVIAKAADIAFADWTLIFDEKGNMLPFDQWPRGYRSLVGVEVKTRWVYVKDPETKRRKRVRDGIETIIKVPKQKDGLELLARLMKMVGVDSIEYGGKVHRPLTIGGEADWNAV